MSLKLRENEALLSVFGYGWNDKTVDSGEAGTEDGYVIKDISDAGDYDWGSDLNWDAVADYIGIDITDGYYLGEDGTVYTDDDGDGIYTDENGYEYDGDGDYNPYGYYEDYDGVQYTDYDGNGVYTDDYGNEYPGEGTYFPSEVLTNKIDTGLSNLGKNEEAIYECMANHNESTGIPARIIVTNLPDLLEYTNGDAIDFTGIVVCAYTSLTARTPFIRQDWGGPRHNQVPFDELTFPVTTAEKTTDDIVLPELAYKGTIKITSAAKCRNMFYGLFKLNGLGVRFESDSLEQKAESAFNTIDTKYGDRILMFNIGRMSYDADEGFENVTHIQLVVLDSSATIGNFIALGTRRYWQYFWNINGYTEGGDWVVNVVGYQRSSTSSTTLFIGNRYTKYNLGELGSYSEYTACNLNVEEKSSDIVPVQWQTDYQEDPYEASFEITVT